MTCNVSDDKGQTASDHDRSTSTAAATAAAAQDQTLCSINFDRDKRRPARVDNEAKACLDDVALNRSVSRMRLLLWSELKHG